MVVDQWGTGSVEGQGAARVDWPCLGRVPGDLTGVKGVWRENGDNHFGIY